MSGLELNKIVGAILVPVLAIMVISKIGDSLVHPRAHGPASVQTSGPAQPKAEPKEEKIEPIAPLLAKADVGKGKSLARKCAACHSFGKGEKPKIGPNLYGIVNAHKAHESDFNYSSAMKEQKGNWTYEELNHFLHNPRKYVPGTKMVFPGFKKPEDRADVIAFLRSLADSPAPLPKSP